MLSATRLTDLLGAVGLFAGPPPQPPADGAHVPGAGPGPGPELSAPHAARLAGLPPSSARWVRDPLQRADPPSSWVPQPLLLAGAGPARQTSSTICGAAVLTMLRYAGDPAAALHVATADDPAAVFAADQRRTHRSTTRATPGPSWLPDLPTWPPAFGTPPWGAAARARYGPVRFTHRVIGAPGSTAARRVLDAALAAAGAGIPVPLFSGGDLRRGMTTAVPRHVVLLTDVSVPDGAGGRRGATATLYEPSSGTLHRLPAALLCDDGPGRWGDAPDPRGTAARTRALGGWPHLVWAILPRGT